jgi:glyoxylase-like metal-dependent hydrolase (beta-lactamase superfamily II)
MKLAVLGSGSRGNALAIHTDGATLLVDAGLGLKALERRAAEAGIPLAPMVGIVLTHEHGDHTRSAAHLAAASAARCSPRPAPSRGCPLRRRWRASSRPPATAWRSGRSG